MRRLVGDPAMLSAALGPGVILETEQGQVVVVAALGVVVDQLDQPVEGRGQEPVAAACSNTERSRNSPAALRASTRPSV